MKTTKWRVAEWPKKESTPGGAAGLTQEQKSSAQLQDPLQGELSTTDTSVTAGTGPGESLITQQNPQSTTPAEPTSETGAINMGWTENPQRLVEEPWRFSPEAFPLEVLEGDGERLKAISEGRGERVDQTIRDICFFYADAAHPVAYDGTIHDAVILYLTNEVL